MKRRSLALKTVIGLAITSCLFLFLFRYIKPAQVSELITQTRWSLWSLGLGMWLSVYFVRAERFVTLAPRTPYLTMLCITSVHNFFVRLLPLRTGEFAYGLMIKRAGTAGIGESMIGLLLLRIMDSTMVLVLFAVALAFHQGVYLGDRRLGIASAMVVALLSLGMLLSLTHLLRLGVRCTRWSLRLLRLDSQRLNSLVDRAAGAIDSCAAVSRWQLVKITLLTLVQWLLTFGAFFAIMRSFSMPVSLAQTTLGSTASVVTGFLPIGGIGSFGTLEAGWALGFVLVGLDKTRAITSGFGVSLSTFSYVAFLGLLGWIGLGVIRKREALPHFGEQR